MSNVLSCEEMAHSVSSSRWNLAGKTALVTGATKGIGKAITEELARLGASVYVCARSENDLKEKLQEWKDEGLAVNGSICDVSLPESRKQLMIEVSDHFTGKLNILVNNAARLHIMPTLDVSSDEVSLMMRTNFESGFHLSQLAHPLLKASGDGSIVFISSIAATLATGRDVSIYCSTKGALNQLTRSLAFEWAKDRIRINTVAPGYTFSDMLNQVLEKDAETSNLLKARIPLRRLGQGHEIGAAVAFLCMPCSSYTTGSIITIDGGVSTHQFAQECLPIEEIG